MAHAHGSKNKMAWQGHIPCTGCNSKQRPHASPMRPRTLWACVRCCASGKSQKHMRCTHVHTYDAGQHGLVALEATCPTPPPRVRDPHGACSHCRSVCRVWCGRVRRTWTFTHATTGVPERHAVGRATTFYVRLISQANARMQQRDGTAGVPCAHASAAAGCSRCAHRRRKQFGCSLGYTACLTAAVTCELVGCQQEAFYYAQNVKGGNPAQGFSQLLSKVKRC